MARKDITATIGASTTHAGKTLVTLGRTSDLQALAVAADALSSISLGGLTTAQVGTLQSSTQGLVAALSKDVIVSLNATTVVTRTKLRAALEAIAANEDGANLLTP